MWNMQELWIQSELTMTRQSRTITSRRKERYTWYCVCVVKCSWCIKPSRWTMGCPTPMTTWKPRSRETSTRSTTWTRECARSCSSLLSPCSVFAVTLIPCTHRMSQDVRVFVSSHPCMRWAFSLTSSTSPSPSSSSSHSSSSPSSSFYPSTSPRLSSKIPCALHQGDGVHWRILLHTVSRPNCRTRKTRKPPCGQRGGKHCQFQVATTNWELAWIDRHGKCGKITEKYHWKRLHKNWRIRPTQKMHKRDATFCFFAQGSKSWSKNHCQARRLISPHSSCSNSCLPCKAKMVLFKQTTSLRLEHQTDPRQLNTIMARTRHVLEKGVRRRGRRKCCSGSQRGGPVVRDTWFPGYVRGKTMRNQKLVLYLGCKPDTKLQLGGRVQ